MDIHALPCLRYEKQMVKPFDGRIPMNPKTLGEHIRKRRMELGLCQSDIAKLFKVSKDCIYLWESNRNSPQTIFYPRIIEFLGYFPFDLDISTSMGSIKAYRYLNGLSQKRFAKMMNVDPKTVNSWEIGLRILSKINKLQFSLLLETSELMKNQGYPSRKELIRSLEIDVKGS